MKIYIKNTENNNILILEAKNYESLFKDFRQEPYRLATDNEIEAYELQEAKKAKKQQCLSYLGKTDWYAVRFAETQVAIPDDILENRARARSLQEKIEACETLEELENININFS
jgi:hypothetical protein